MPAWDRLAEGLALGGQDLQVRVDDQGPGAGQARDQPVAELDCLLQAPGAELVHDVRGVLTDVMR